MSTADKIIVSVALFPFFQYHVGCHFYCLSMTSRLFTQLTNTNYRDFESKLLGKHTENWKPTRVFL